MTWPNETILRRFPPQFEYVIIGLSTELRRTICSHIMAHAFAKSSGVQLSLERPVWPMKKRAQTLTLRIPPRSGGMVTGLKNLLSSMNFEGVSQWNTSSDGQIVINIVWKSKAVRCRQTSAESGLHPIYLPRSGSPVMESPWTLPPSQL